MTSSSGTTVWQGEFKPFGESLSVTGSITNNLRFPGQYNDSETGLHQNWYRDYKPELARYVESDPILLPIMNLGSELKIKPIYSSCSKSRTNMSWHVPRLLFNPQDIHPYFYTKNNPVKFTDPLGLKACCKECYVFCACELAICACSQNKCGNTSFLGIYYISPAAPYSLRAFTCNEFDSAI